MTVDRLGAGIDGCRGGWLVASVHGVKVLPQLTRAALLELEATAVGVDMPIGLPTSTSRSCDRRARRELGARGSTVFPAPPRACLNSPSYSIALERARTTTGVGISKQSFHLLPKISELDSLVEPTDGEWIAEMHPELSFLEMNGGAALPSKHTPAGLEQRCRLLGASAAIAVPAAAPKGATMIDVVDAMAVMWSAARWATGAHRTVGGDEPERDGRGLLMRIVV